MFGEKLVLPMIENTISTPRASGARILVTLLYEMTRRDVHKGIAALCLGGGNAVALAVER